MTYNFVVVDNPTRNAHTDIDFTSDIVYKRLADNDLDKNNIFYINDKVEPSTSVKKIGKPKKKRMDIKKHIYVIFIFILILILIGWYVYIKKSNNNDEIITITYVDSPELVMMTPDFGTSFNYNYK
jgi:hypothetical protein